MASVAISATSPKWPMNYHYSFVHTVAEGGETLFALQKAWGMRLG
jgi:hypothetical protein